MATLVRFREPFREFAALQNEMGRLMNGMLDGNGRTNQAWVPAVDVWETDEEVVYAFDLPGISEDERGLVGGGDQRLPTGSRNPEGGFELRPHRAGGELGQ